MPKLYTVGFTKKSAGELFQLLQDKEVTLVADVRLNNCGQLAGYTKGRDLEFFLSLVGIDYQYWKDFAPTKAIRDAYHADRDFERYAESYRQLLADREAVAAVPQAILEAKTVCLLCSEATAENCHRRLAAECLAVVHRNLEIVHL